MWNVEHMSNTLKVLQLSKPPTSGGETMRMCKAAFDELVDQMAEVCDGLDTIDAIRVEVVVGDTAYVIETVAEPEPVKYPRIDSIHGTVH